MRALHGCGGFAQLALRNSYRYMLLAVLAAASIYFLYLVRVIFLSLALAVLLVYLINPVVVAVEKKGTPRVWAIAIVYLALTILFVSLILYGMPYFLVQMDNLAEALPRYIRQAQQLVENLQAGYARAGIPEVIRNLIDQRLVNLEGYLVALVNGIVEGILGMAGYLLNVLLAPVLAFYLLRDAEAIKARIINFIPAGLRGDALHLGHEIDQVLNNFVRGYLLVGLIVGALTAGALSLLGLEFAIMLGIFAGIMEFIPYFGPFIGAVPAVALAGIQSWWLVLKVVIVFVIIQQLESIVISPKILGNRVGLHPVLVIMALLAGGQLYGLVGVLVAVPIVAVLKVVAVFVWRRMALSSECP